MERLFFRGNIKPDCETSAAGVMLDRQKYVIGVTGIGAGAGATFAAMGMAFIMGRMASGVTYLEGQPHRKDCVSPYRLLAVDRAFRHIAEKDRSSAGRLNLYKKVNWQVYKPWEQEEGCRSQDYRQAVGKIIIVDNPYCFDDLDLVVAVVDPFPPAVSAGLETFVMLRRFHDKESAARRKVIWLLNKSDGSVACRETEKYLKIKFDFEQRLIPQEIFYRSAYSCTQPFFMYEAEGLSSMALSILEEI